MLYKCYMLCKCCDNVVTMMLRYPSPYQFTVVISSDVEYLEYLSRIVSQTMAAARRHHCSTVISLSRPLLGPPSTVIVGHRRSCRRWLSVVVEILLLIIYEPPLPAPTTTRQ